MPNKKFSNIQYAPFEMHMQPGRYLWCSCGESKKQPFCDGSHEQTGMFPKLVILEEAKMVSWCGCKSSEHAPFCDGTHKKFKKKN